MMLNSVCANLARSTFWASAHTDNRGTANWPDCLSLSDDLLSLSIGKKLLDFLKIYPKLSLLLEQSCDEAHFFLSSVVSCVFCWRLRIERPQPAVIVPNREKARFTIGELGTLFGRGDSMSGTCRKLELFSRWLPPLCGDMSVGAGRANSSATGTCGDPNPVWMPYSISYR